MLRTQLTSLVFIIALFSLAGCSDGPPSDNYQGPMGEIQTVDYGTVVDAQMVRLRGNSSSLGLLTGAGFGAIAGSAITGSGWGLVTGAFLGGAAGNSLDHSSNGRHYAVRYIISLDNRKTIDEVNITRNESSYDYADKTYLNSHKVKAKTISIVQGLKRGDIKLIPGDRVMVLNGGTDRARVRPVNTYLQHQYW